MVNLVSVNVPIGLHLMAERGQVKEGDKVVIVCGGSGIVASRLGLVLD
ncbi:MAG: hypothetical protein ACXU8A_05875 [Burkholderiaceae bacterium]